MTSNLVYLDELTKRSDIILLQEHWLYSHEKNNLYIIFTDFNCHIKCFQIDDVIIDDVLDRKRAHAGVAICVNNIVRILEKLPDGSNRIAAIHLNFNVPPRINWNKIDKSEYQRLIELYLQSKITNLTIENFDEFVISACKIITQTADTLQPPNSRKRGKNSRYWTPNMTEILNRSKFHYWMWKQEETSDKSSIHFQQMRAFKKKLRSEQRKIEVAKRQSKFTKIMSLSDRND
ncbi:unnamed protein product [Mytilus coruscus]|uniref:Endonuclease/exonuclease/phosphatase domain-containing protein n=1 Tax=Mytilus coruscus TaxID=42192 RepID=A0A6J8AGL6_MYTCO|nr:unnamed protein product [Mytilus coruscus]